MTSAKLIGAAIKAIPEKKEDLKKAFEELQAHASCLSSFTLQWKDLDDHISSVERSLEERFRELESKEAERAVAPPEKAKVGLAFGEEEEEVDPRPELRSLCVKMDGNGLRVFINENRKDLLNLRKELNRAIRAAADPAKLVLDAMNGFYPAKAKAEGAIDGELHANRRTCTLLLERLHLISPEIKPSVQGQAKKLAKEWKGKMSQDGGQNNVESLAFLQLLASYGIASEFEADDLVELLIPVARRKQVPDLSRNLGLTEKMPDFVQKLSSRGKQLEAVKFVYAFGLVDKFPPVPLLKECVKESKKLAEEVRKKGNNSTQSQNEATARELAALKAVIKTIEEFKLESEYSPESLQKRVMQLEKLQKEKAARKRPASGAAVTNPKGQAKQQQANKRPRLSTATPAVAAHPLAPVSHPQPQHPLIDRAPAPFMASTGPYGLSGSSYLYEHTANPLGLGASRSPPRSSFLYSDPLAGSGLYDRSGAYGSYSLSGALPPQYNSSLYR